MILQLNHVINFWKINTIIFIIILMNRYNNYSITAYTYLTIHGNYGILWCTKSLLFLDKSFIRDINLFEAFYSSIYLLLYWIFPFHCISNYICLSNFEVLMVQTMFILGTFLHFCSDCQKYYVLLEKKKYIHDGFFYLTRNPNYLGELLIYSSFVLCTRSLFCFIILLFNVTIFWIPMIKKDRHLHKYNDFKNNQNHMFIPYIW